MKRLTAIWSRDVNPSRLAGRTKMIQAIRSEISANYAAEHLRLQNILEKRSLRSVAGLLIQALRTLATGSLPSLQCLLFCDRQNHHQILQKLHASPPYILYCDGVRTFYFLSHMGKLRSQMRIVVDFDDLMSRRMQSLGAAGTGLSLGYLHDKLPLKLRSALSLGFISKMIARYEEAALTQVENRIGQWADVVVLISQVEAQSLKSRYLSSNFKAKVHVIPPEVKIVHPPQFYESFSRFIFIGTDTLPQNKLTIQLILELWKSLKPVHEIHIYGHMVTRWPEVSGVIFRGYANTLEDVYAEGSVLFAPGVLRGGLKTKVLEAFAFGTAVIGNEITFEGLNLGDNPLQISISEQIADILRNPLSSLTRMRMSAISGQEYVRLFLGREQFQQNWHNALDS